MKRRLPWLPFLLVAGFFAFIGCSEDAGESDYMEQIDHIINSRQLREAGYDKFQTTKVTMRYTSSSGEESIDTSSLRRQKRSLAASTLPITLHVNSHNHQFVFNLNQSRTVLHPKSTIQFRSGNYVEEFHGELPDCFLTGSLVSHDHASASFSYCTELRGTFSYGPHVYWVEGIDDGRSGFPPRDVVLVARKPMETNSNPHEIQPSRFMESISGDRKRKHRRKREDYPILPITIEIAVIADEKLTAVMRADGATDAELVEMMTFKWIGAQSEWARADQLYYDVTLAIKRMEFWENNPFMTLTPPDTGLSETPYKKTWYQPAPVLNTFLNNFCRAVNNQDELKEFDHVHLVSGETSSGDEDGMAYVGGVCKGPLKCGISLSTDVTDYYLITHELGHNMNMIHDDVYTECASPKDGIMGRKYSGWTICSARDMDALVSGLDCLTQDNVNVNYVNVALAKQWPGMVYTKDEVCEFRHRSGWRYRSYPAKHGEGCAMYSCIDMNVGSPTYGTMVTHGWPIPGAYCGESMVCHRLDGCISYSVIGLNSTLYTVQTGGWGRWGAMTSCSRTCGAGVRYRQRTCNNPRPLNSADCPGSEYDAHLCNTQPCAGDSSDTDSLIQERAGETCSWLVDHNLIPPGYANTGHRRGDKLHGQCEVRCDVNTTIKPSSNLRFGLMPDGTPCSSNGIVISPDDAYSPPWKTQELSRCVQGYCYPFGCDDAAGELSRDECGVCGGDNSTCHWASGTYTAVLSKGQRDAATVLPARSFRIHVFLTPTGIDGHQIELWSRHGVPVTTTPGTGSSPVHFANTYWYTDLQKQSMHAEGPTNQQVTIKVYNTGSTAINSSLHYQYSTPLESADDDVGDDDKGGTSSVVTGAAIGGGVGGFIVILIIASAIYRKRRDRHAAKKDIKNSAHRANSFEKDRADIETPQQNSDATDSSQVYVEIENSYM